MKDSTPRVSIGLPVYNGERYIREALDSVLAQTFKHFELIISDNASTDRTAEICRAYVKADPRIKYFRNEENLGAAANYNRVFRLSSGTYFKWTAHDDIMAPAFLERCVEMLDCYPSAVLCYPKTLIIDENGERIEHYADNLKLASPRADERYRSYHQRFRVKKTCNPIAGLIRSRMLNMTPLIGNYVASDMILLGELSLLGEFMEVPEYLFYRRIHPMTSVQANPGLADRAVWFDPGQKGRIQLTVWRWFYEYVRAVMRAPLNLTERVLCLLQTGIWLGWNSVRLRKDLRNALSQLLGRSYPGRILLESGRALMGRNRVRRTN